MGLGDRPTTSKMDEYDKKFAEMQKYIPFLEAMIERLQNVKDKSREVQLQKMQSLHGILSNSKRKLKIETLQRCEDVLQKLHNKVEKGNTPGLQFANKKSDGDSAQLSTASKNATSDQSALSSKSQNVEKSREEETLDETPASPSPPVSPETGSLTVPIIIPTERSDFPDEKADSKPASPDQVDILPTKAPIIIPTERTGSTPSPSSNHSFAKNLEEASFSEWDMLEECEKSNAKSSSWQGAANNDVVTVPISPNDSSRRSSSVLDKSRSHGENVDVRGCETKLDLSVTTSDNSLMSPDAEHVRHKSSSPRLKDPITIAKTVPKPPAPLLLSPPPVSAAPPLSMEDLAELLNESSDGKSEKKNDKGLEGSLSKKDKPELPVNVVLSKDTKSSKAFLLSQDDLDRESERQWEEVHKHIVKFPSKKALSNASVTSTGSKSEAAKLGDGKGSAMQAGNSLHSMMAHKHHHSVMPGPEVEPRYADNYERRPRQMRDTNLHESSKDKHSSNLYCRLPEDELGVPPHHISSCKSDERLPLYQRRQSNIGPEPIPHRMDTDFRMDGPEYFGRKMPNTGHWPPIHGGVNPNEFCNNTWAPSGSYNIPNPPVHSVPYQHPMGMHQQEMWNVGSPLNPVHTEPHMMNEVPHRGNQFSPNMNAGIRPLMSPNTHPQDIPHMPRGDSMHDDLPNGPIIQPLMSPTNFPMGPQFHNFQGEPRSYEQQFDRGMEYNSHVRSSWDSPGKNDSPFRGESDAPCGMIGADVPPASTSGSYPRASTPCHWTRDRDRCSRGRGREPYYNDRNRNETRTNFNRDVRRPEWSGGNHSEWDARFNRDPRNISERDPRLRMEHNVQPLQMQNSMPPKDNSNSAITRDPRLAKDKHAASIKLKDPTYNDRDPRKRQITPGSSSEKAQAFSPRRCKEKSKSPKASDSYKKPEAENVTKVAQEKLLKEKVQPTLESLYGVIDTKAKIGQSSLQNFKIPKIKRAESQSALPLNIVEKTEESKEEAEKIDNDDTRVEVTSSSDGNVVDEDWGGDSACWLKNDSQLENTSPKCVESVDTEAVKIGEADSVMDVTTELSSNTETSTTKVERTEESKPKEEVTQEYIESLIKKSLESGEGKKLVEQAKLMQKLSEALEPKKLQKIKKILESETESSSSEREDDIGLRKLVTRKKVRRIVSDSSDEECLANRLRSLNTTPAPEKSNELSDSEEIPVESKQSSSTPTEKSIENIASEADTVQKTIAVLDLLEDCGKNDDKESRQSKELEESTEPTVTKDSRESNEDADETVDLSHESHELNDSDLSSKTPKVKTKRRNSLEMLQEDIREMFICDEVVTATGYRVCRMQKEVQHSTPVASPNQASSAVTKKDNQIAKKDAQIAKKDTQITKKEKQATKKDALITKKDSQVVKKDSQISKKDEQTNKREADTNKSKSKAKSGRKSRPRGKRILQSSDSEEDQPLALRAALIPTSTPLPDEEDTHDANQSESRKRGKRIAKKNTKKEEEKIGTEVAKLESSKASFDSSSEEDFSIDVSKLTAAVDDSLLLEKQSVPEIDKTSQASEEKDSSSLLETSNMQSKSMDTESFCGGDSLSNTSMVTAKESSFNEELLSNILVGLVPTKSDEAKTIDKGTDADVDEDTNDQQPGDQVTKKNVTKKKKKKWRMGILSKKKRKRTLASSPKIESDHITINSVMDDSQKSDVSPAMLDDPSSDKSPKNHRNDVDLPNTEIVKDSSRDVDADGSIKSISQASVEQTMLNEQAPDTGTTPLETETSVKEEPKDVNNETESAELEGSKENISLSESIEDKKARELQAVYSTLRDFSIDQWTEYALTGQDKYQCWICFFSGKNIVHHYKVQHAGSEILISRLKAADAKAAIKEIEEGEAEKSTAEPSMEEHCKLSCRICGFKANGPRIHALEAFYEHCTTHTGEYRFRCVFCSYQSVAKGSMRTHFYKVCRRFTRVCNDSIAEDEIPKDFSVYGYLCSLCNFVQLIKSNAEKHIKFWHSEHPDVKILKINMSTKVAKKNLIMFDQPIKTETPTPSTDAVNATLVKSLPETVDDISEIPKDEEIPKESTNTLESDSHTTVVDQKEDDSIKILTEVMPDKTQVIEDTSICSKKLSVFVCPPELESKEVEIQLERKKTMEKIIEDIGIKLNQSALRKGLSITDKLTDKMRTDLAVETGNSSLITDTSLKDANNSLTLEVSLLPEKNLKALESVQCVPPINKETALPSRIEEASTANMETNDPKKKSDLEALSQTNSRTTEENETSDVKVRDPLISVVEGKKDDESELDVSDNENTRDSAPLYDFDSSSEQSDPEFSPDVHTLLKETSNISATSKDPMLTTIQRLAAQLQAAKPHVDSSKSESIQDTSGASTPDLIPELPDMVPITTAKNIVNQLESSKCNIISSESQSSDESSVKCIRLRRLSGDILSMNNNQDDSTAFPSDIDQTNTQNKTDSTVQSDTDEECSFLKIENVVSLAPSADNSGTESPLIHDIRKAVETSPIKLGVSVLKRSNCPLILKRAPFTFKSSSIQKGGVHTIQKGPKDAVKLIPLKNASSTMSKSPLTSRAQCFIPIAPKAKAVETKLVSVETSKGPMIVPRTVMKTTVASGNKARPTTLSSQPTPLNYKIVKLLKQPNILKPRDSSNQIPAMKIKSIEAYNAMLTPVKLSHFYKCMGRDCQFTTDLLVAYFQHYQQHAAEAEKKSAGGPSYDYQKCAYCYLPQENWNQMKMHLEEKHEHCRFQCGFCFYRSIVLSYARVHQELTHPGCKRVIVCKVIKDPRFLKEDFNRYEFVHPYVCQHECKKIFYVPEAFVAHLKSKHATPLTAYKCHLCSSSFPKIDQLITHYKIHGFYKFQCLYCLHGADAYDELHSHLSTFHYNKIPQILERSLPARIIRGKDVIQQLIIKQFDEPLTQEKGNDGGEFLPQSAQVQSPKDATTPLSKNEIEGGKKPVQGILWQFKSHSTVKNTITSPQLEKSQSADGRKDMISIRDILHKESSSPTTHLKASEETSAEKPVKNITPIFSGGKFIALNILPDNSSVLKPVSHGASNVELSINSKGDDSDIEILETIDKSEVKRKNNADVLSAKEKLKIEVVPEFEQSKGIKSSNPENSNVLNHDNERISDKPLRASKPLTLDDIKDTGFAGTKLYKCGYKTCTFAGRNLSQLKAHVKQCPKSDQSISCPHCNKPFVKAGCLVEHLKLHGLKRFGCSLCPQRFSVSYQALGHMKTKHKVTGTKLVPADPTNPSAGGLFVVQRWGKSGQRKRRKRKPTGELEETDKLSEKLSGIEKSSFNPDEIEQLPRQAIYSREVQCAVCPYTTKVRTNIIRHLQLHAKAESVPESGPVNPVPCLDKKERMFDKMVNLASSSHQNGRMGAKPKESNKTDDEESMPKFIPEHQRYVCGVAECNYLTVDEAMLRYHLKALHSDEPYFRCPHCPQPSQGQENLNIAIDKMGIHLKMHDARLYKCSHCNYHHYHRHVVERHLTDKHSEKRPFVKVIRETESTDNVQQSVQEDAEDEVPDPDGNHWKCNICDFKCVYKAEMVTHACTAHDEKYQFKCTLCTFKTSGKILFEQHIISKHNNDPNVDFILVYQRIKGVNKRSTAETTDQGSQDEPFDTTPLWRRDMPRVRHIRGILLEEESNTSESSQKSGKRKSDTEMIAGKPAKAKSAKSAILDEDKQSKDKVKRTLSFEKILSDADYSNESLEKSGSSTPVTLSGAVKKESNDSLEIPDRKELKCGNFGPYGTPVGNMYSCTLCSKFNTKYKHDMRDHLYRELNYARWQCKECGHSAVNRPSLVKHCYYCHRNKAPKEELLPVDKAIEFWVHNLLKSQTALMKQSAAESSSNTSGVKSSSDIDDTNETEAFTSDDSKISIKKESSEDQTESNKAPVTADTETGKPLTCKHCKMIFTRWRGFKLHVQLTHLKRLGFVCPYCDRSTNSETLMRQHIKVKHPGCEEKIIENPAAGGPELSSEFWQKEYGVVFPMKTRKRKRDVTTESANTEKDTTNEKKVKLEKCSICTFTAISFAGLKAHMRSHGVKPTLKCSQCAFTTTVKADLWDHWKASHPHLPFKIDPSSIPGASTSTTNTQKETTNAQKETTNSQKETTNSQKETTNLQKENHIPDYNEDIEEEEIVAIETASSDMSYSCFYCNFRNKSTDVIKAHWSMLHKHTKMTSESSTTKVDLPFRYKEVESTPAQRMGKTPPGSAAIENIVDDLAFYDDSSDVGMVDGSAVQDEGWVCQWCNELCDCETKIKAHQNMFHSHLPLNFKRADGRDPPKGYCCPECPYTTTFIHLMKNHISKHINLFKCKYCDRTFSAASYVAAHSAEVHPDLEVKINSIQNFDFLMENLMARVQWITWEEYIDKKFDQVASPNKNSVAKKSTTKSSILISPTFSKVVKAVARKSTNSLPRNLLYNFDNNKSSGSVVKSEPHLITSKGFSFYGVPQPPVDLAQLNTYMVVGGHRMKVKCITLTQLININAKVMVEDLKYNTKYASFLSKLN